MLLGIGSRHHQTPHKHQEAAVLYMDCVFLSESPVCAFKGTFPIYRASILGTLNVINVPFPALYKLTAEGHVNTHKSSILGEDELQRKLLLPEQFSSRLLSSGRYQEVGALLWLL